MATDDTPSMNAQADATARQKALDATGSFIVQAPAGSGKTELLTQRYLRLLATVEKPEQIWAMTFTRKAAGEMRTRVLNAIAAAEDNAPDAPHKALTWRLARAVRERDAACNWQLAAFPARLRIDTVDAFAGSLTRRLPLTARLGMTPAIADNGNELYAEAAHRTVALLDDRDFGDAVATVLAHVDNNVLKLEGLLAAMLTKRDQWLRLIGHGERDWLQAALAREVASQLEWLRASIPSRFATELAELTGKALANLARAKGESPDYDGSALPGTLPDDAGLWKKLADTWLTNDGTWRRRLDKNGGFPPDQKELKAQATSLLAQLTTVPELDAQLAVVRQLPPVEYTDEQWRILQALMALLPVAVAQLKLVFSEKASVDFSEISLSALQALGEPEEPTDLALALDYRLQHILVDEFQDTSWSQYALLERLTAGWEPDDGRTLFLVGDPMQSIYRFREAEVGLFLRARRDGIGTVHPEPLTLGINFRSTATVIDWINTRFSTLFPATEDIAAGAIPYAPATAHSHEQEGGVEVVARFDSDARDEATRIVELIHARRQTAADETIAILVRSRTHVAEIMPALQQAGLKAQAVELEGLADQPVVQDIVALTRALVHRGDRIAWLSILRAPWCGLTLADLAALAEGDDRDIWTLVNDDERVQTLSADGQARLARVVHILEPAVVGLRRQPLRRLVEQTWLALGGPACVGDAAALDNADAALALLGELDDAGGLLDYTALDERLKKLYAQPAPDADARLQVMTLHKVKGLEFDTVILPALERLPRHDSKQLLLWLERPRLDAEPDFLLAPMTGVDEKKEPLYDGLNAFRKQQDALEQIRLLYVAATRARRRLYLFGNVAVKEAKKGVEFKPPDSSLLGKLWPVLEADFQTAFQTAPKRQPYNDSDPEAAVLHRLVSGWQTPPARKIEWGAGTDVATADWMPVEFSWAGETARQVGILVHALLERIGRDGVAQWSSDRVDALATTLKARLQRQGVPGDELSAACERAMSAVKHVLTDEHGRWLLAEHEAAANEYALTGVLDGEVVDGVIDRTFIDEHGVRWIVDYKTGGHEGGDLQTFLNSEKARYLSQLRVYSWLLKAQEERPQRLGLYYPLLGEWIDCTEEIEYAHA